MNTRRASIRWTIALAALTLWASFAADIDGKWTAQIEGRRGPRTEILMLKVTDNGLTGSIQGGQGGPIQISNGTMDGDNIAFTVVREFQGNKVTEEYKGTVSGGELKLTVSGGRRGPSEVTYKKQ
jgi:hypothetical protein